MASFNRVILVGNLTRDVEVKYTANQTAVTEIGLAINDRRRLPSGEWVDEPTFLEVTLWGRTAEIAGQYLGKGAPVLIEGRLKLDTWESDGQKRSKLRVVGDRMQMLSGRATATSPAPEFAGVGQSTSSNGRESASARPPDEELPF
ncbi:MAG: single-stranded DNA-binding protein [Pirellulaceae bacterium]|jgi:single-strand DNA-binding protein|nr:single-stranded DNA-binding protein [Pirellulaceae bacterium]